MLFAWTANLVAERKKTQTRRLVRSGDSLGYVTDNGVQRQAVIQVSEVWDGSQNKAVVHQRLRWVVGRVYGVQPAMMKPAVCWIEVTAIHRELDPLKICDLDAKAEGYQDAADFVKHWKKNHRVKPWDPPRAVWVISFKVVGKKKGT